ALIRTENREQRTNNGTRRFRIISLFFVLCSLSLVTGALRATNTWDYPAYLGLSVLTLGLVAWRRYQHGTTWPHVLLHLGWTSLVVVSGSIALFLPFTRHFATDYAGVEIWRGTRTPVGDFLKINGLWLFMLLSGTLLLYHRVRRTSARRLAAIGGVALLLT